MLVPLTLICALSISLYFSQFTHNLSLSLPTARNHREHQTRRSFRALFFIDFIIRFIIHFFMHFLMHFFTLYLVILSCLIRSHPETALLIARQFPPYWAGSLAPMYASISADVVRSALSPTAPVISASPVKPKRYRISSNPSVNALRSPSPSMSS